MNLLLDEDYIFWWVQSHQGISEAFHELSRSAALAVLIAAGDLSANMVNVIPPARRARSKNVR